jgi:hypothetical protein
MFDLYFLSLYDNFLSIQIEITEMKNLSSDSASALSRIRSASRFLQGMATLGFIFVCGLSVVFIANPAWFDSVIRDAFPELPGLTALTPTKRIGLMGVSALPLFLSLYGLWHLRLLFAAYRDGKIFGDEAPAHLLKVGLAMAGNAFAGVLAHSLGSLILTYGNAPGERHFSVMLSDNTYTLILTGGLLVVIGWVMGEAARISDEIRQII